MYKLNIIEDYKHYQIANIRHTNLLLDKIKDINFGNETEIELNIEGCMTDYPATPIFMDYFLFHLENQEGQKEFTIILDGIYNKEIYILYDIVLEGDFFNIKEKNGSEEEIKVWKEIINKKLKNENIIIKIIISHDKKEFFYGI